MNSVIRARLVKILTEQGLNIVREPVRCETLLNPTCSKERKEGFLLVSALKAGIVSQLIGGDPKLPIDSLIQRITRKLHKSLDIVEQSSRWAVESWAVALG